MLKTGNRPAATTYHPSDILDRLPPPQPVTSDRMYVRELKLAMAMVTEFDSPIDASRRLTHCLRYLDEKMSAGEEITNAKSAAA